MSALPALLGGEPLFAEALPIARPTVEPDEALMSQMRRVIASGMLVNGEVVARFEQRAAEYLNVKHAVAVSSCTAGLMLVFRALDLRGDVVLPSFTFPATGHSLLWNQLRPAFADISEETFNLELQRVEEAITPATKAILAVHIFGNPCEVEALERLCRRHGLSLVFDSAHAWGSLYEGRKIGGFGDAEVFSLSPTKLVVAGEGGLVATNDDALARVIRMGRNYGNPGSYDCEFPGLSARLPEFSALLALATLERIEPSLDQRDRLAALYRMELSDLPGISFQHIPPDRRTTYKDFAILIDPETFGMTREHLRLSLEAENIATRPYFHPPLHKQRAYEDFRKESQGRLPVTEKVSGSVLCLPIYSHMESGDVEKVCEAIRGISRHAEEVVDVLGRRSLEVAV